MMHFLNGIYSTMRQEIQNLCFSLSIDCLKLLDHKETQHTKICDISGVKLLTKLRVHFSALKERCFKHAFDCLSPLCFCSKDKENSPIPVTSWGFFKQLPDISGLDIATISNMNDDTLCHRLLFGDPSLGTIENRVILEATISFIKILPDLIDTAM